VRGVVPARARASATSSVRYDILVLVPHAMHLPTAKLRQVMLTVFEKSAVRLPVFLTILLIQFV
jgi:hypothetical protein